MSAVPSVTGFRGFLVSGASRGLGRESCGPRSGADAYMYATQAGRALLAEDERWRGLSESTTADDATPEHLDPLGHH